MALDVSWNNLPSVVLLEVFQRISHQERIRASSTCKEWRKALYFPNFWREINLKIFSEVDKNSIERCHFFTTSFITSSRNVTIICGNQEEYLVEMKRILYKLSQNRQLERLVLVGVGSPVWSEILRSCTFNLISIIDNTKKLDTLCLGHYWFGAGDLSFRSSLEKHQSSLRCLQLGPGFDAEHCHAPCSPVDFSMFCQLQIVSLNHSYVTDDVVIQLGDHGLLKRLIVQVEDPTYQNLDVKDETWEYFHQTKPDCELRLNIIQIYSESVMTSFPFCMPITHVKILYCDKVSLQSMSLLASFKELRSVCCIVQNHSGDIIPSENPFVMCAWCCPKFEELAISGYKLDYEDLIGIARLAGSRLKKLQVHSADIIKLFDVDNTNEWVSRNLTPAELKRFKTQMSRALNRLWTTLDDAPGCRDSDSFTDEKALQVCQLLAEDHDL